MWVRSVRVWRVSRIYLLTLGKTWISNFNKKWRNRKRGDRNSQVKKEKREWLRVERGCHSRMNF